MIVTCGPKKFFITSCPLCTINKLDKKSFFNKKVKTKQYKKKTKILKKIN